MYTHIYIYIYQTILIGLVIVVYKKNLSSNLKVVGCDIIGWSDYLNKEDFYLVFTKSKDLIESWISKTVMMI